jgi:CubicO group peptidase (beta-lactamase class C family)
MTANQTGELKAGFTDGMGMGLGFQVVREPVGVTAMLSPGTYGHGGAHGTQGWIDPVKKTIHIMLIQRAGLKNGDASPMRQAFQDAAAAALSKPE